MSIFERVRISDIDGTKVLVTGGSTGIGAAVVRAFAAQVAYGVAHYKET